MKYFKNLIQKKYRTSERKFLVEGVHLVEEALSSRWTVEALLVTSSFKKKKEWGNMELRGESGELMVFDISEREIAKLSDTVTPQGIVAVVRMKEYDLNKFWNELPMRCLIIALDDVSDPGNVGTILRTCDWFGVDAVFLNSNTVELYNPKVVRASMGAIFHLPVFDDINLPKVLNRARTMNFTIVATAVHGGKPLTAVPHGDRTFFVFGSESRGLSDDLSKQADIVTTIPRFGKAESLNVAISCGIVLSSVKLFSR